MPPIYKDTCICLHVVTYHTLHSNQNKIYEKQTNMKCFTIQLITIKVDIMNTLQNSFILSLPKC